MDVKGSMVILEDDREMLSLIGDYFTDEGYRVELFTDPEDTLKAFEEKDYDLLVCDIKLTGISGIEVLERLREISPATPVILITAYSSISSAIESIKKGAFHYIPKPFSMEELNLIVEKAMEDRALRKENVYLRREVEKRYSFSNIIGKSKAMCGLYRLVEILSQNSSNVMICGESGTGKEIVARAIHYNGIRKERPFVAVNCSAIPETLLESELFGHTRGAFTGAYREKKGLFVEANKGTLFLDEVGDMDLSIQVKLLRVIQEKTVRPVGAVDGIPVDVRIICATNKNLEEEVKKGNFREDLFYRLNVIPLMLPPLRERAEDIPLLVNHFIRKFSKEMGKGVKGISKRGLAKIIRYPWPGNIRELENVIERAITFSEGNIIEEWDITMKNEGMDDEFEEIIKERPTLQEMKHRYIERILRETGGNRAKTARILGISRRALYRKGST